MDTLQIAIWVATVAGLAGLAWAFFTHDGLPVRLGALGAFAIFYFGVLLWAPTDPTWFNLTTASILVVTLGSRMVKRPPAHDTKPVEPSDDPEDRSTS